MLRALRSFTFVATLASLGTSLCMVSAQAMPDDLPHHPKHTAQHHRATAHGTKSLTVKNRNFVDDGNVVPVGTRNSYSSANVGHRETLGEVGNGKYGNQTLPGKFDLPGRQEPLFTF